MKICVFGASSDELASGYFEKGGALGRELARRGHTLIFGGGAKGLMGAAARGARAHGGEIIGIAPTFFDRPGILFEHCTEFIFTETMAQRKTKMEELADAFIALPGGLGTFEEFFEVYTLKQLGRHRKPIALLDEDEYFVPLRSLLEHSARAGFIPAGNLKLYGYFEDPAACLDYVELE